ncbi:MAG: FtsW/RodA/SpoVE family cell cycle protein, partial [Luteimonas sp.]
MNAILHWLLDVAARLSRTLDLWLCAALAALMAIALAVLYSAGGESLSLVIAQGARFAVGVAALWALSRVPPHRLRNATPAAYALTLLPLLLVLAIGTGKHGRHWIDLKLFYFQPAELLKLTLPMMAAWYLNRERLPPRFGVVLVAAAIIGVPTGLILLQPDFGTAMLVGISGAFVLYLAGLSWWWFAAAFGGVGAGAPPAGGWLRPDQKDRILTFLNPESAPLGSGWNIIQSKIAIGAGGFTGKGWGQGTQSHLNYLPEHTTDFIFAVLSEEFGWIGVATVL